MTRESAHVAALRVALGKRLAGHRERNNLSQRKFAERVYYDRTSISKIETGYQPAPRAFWCEADRLLDTGGELVAAFDALSAAKASDGLTESHRDGQPADGLVAALAPLMLPVARAMPKVRLTSASPDEIDTVVELGDLTRALVEHCRRVVMGEPADWAELTERLSEAGRHVADRSLSRPTWVRSEPLTVRHDLGPRSPFVTSLALPAAVRQEYERAVTVYVRSVGEAAADATSSMDVTRTTEHTSSCFPGNYPRPCASRSPRPPRPSPRGAGRL